jgi:putative tricarboxylic transport membrane protein
MTDARKPAKVRYLIAGMISAAALAVAGTAMAQKFPDKPIQVVIHSSYGGGTDTTARMMMIRSRRTLKTDMSIIAKRGGSGAKAHAYVKSKPRDGYTIMAVTQTHPYTLARGKSKLTIDDFVGVALAMDDPTLITVNAKSKFKTLADLIKASKDKPLNWGVAQIGGTEHVGLFHFAKAAGIKFKAVPLGSGAQMVQPLMAQKIDATLPNLSEALIQVKDGTFRALAVLAEKRLKDFPDIPTSYEQGFKVKLSTTRGYEMLKGTPRDRIDILSKGLVKVMHHGTFANYLKGAGLTPEESVAGSKVWTRQLKEEYAKAAQSLKELGLNK